MDKNLAYQNIDLEQTKKIFHTLFDDIDGRSLSLKGREDKDLKSKSYVYGEVVPDSFYEIINETNPQPGQIFFDLGSGTGKAVILAHLLFPYKEVIGVELLDPLYQASAKVINHYEAAIRPEIADKVKNKKMTLIHGSLLDVDVKNADMIFINSTCFQEDLMELIEVKLEELQPHAQVITLSKSLKSPSFHQYKHKLYEFSWGQATAFFHRKRLWKVYF